ncbi:MAG: hypothetical protein ABR559_02370 [Gemmatimonadota bacterium]
MMATLESAAASRARAPRRRPPSARGAGWPTIRRLALAALIPATGCATTLEREAREAATGGVDPGPLLATLGDQYAAITATKRILAITLVEGRRRYRGDGVVWYRAAPRRLRAEVFGPQDVSILRARLVGDSLTVVLPREGEVLHGALDDPRFIARTGERAFIGPGSLGALLGAYDVRALAAAATDTAAANDGDRRTLYLTGAEGVQAFTLEATTGRLVEVRHGLGGRLLARVRFADFAAVEGRMSPRSVVLRDLLHDRQLVLTVTRETSDVPADIFASGTGDGF